MRSAFRRMGNSSGLIIPKPLLAAVGAKAGDEVEVTADAGRIIIVPVQTHPRAGWDEDARLIAEAGDDALVWPEFANQDDENWTW